MQGSGLPCTQRGAWRIAEFGLRNQKSVAAAFIADEISILKDYENVYTVRKPSDYGRHNNVS
jgi:hypothetical protein